MDDATFRKRSGTTSRGKEFEDLVVAVLILKMLQDKNLKDFRLSSNDEKYGAFDDVVLETETVQGLQKIQALQLKHINKEKILTKNALRSNRGNFSITKYFEDFCRLRKSYTQIQFVLFTNFKSEAVDGDKMHLDDDGNSEVTMMRVQPDSLLNTCAEGRCYRLISGNEKYGEFFKSFFLYTNQANVEKIKAEVACNFENLFSCGGFPLKEYLDFVSNWSLKEGKKSKLHLVMMKRVLALCALFHHIVPFHFENCMNANSELMQEAVSYFRLTVFKTDNRDRIRRIYSDAEKEFSDQEYALKIALKYLIISKHEDLNNLSDIDKTKLLWLSGKYPLIVIDDYVVHQVIALCKEKFVILSNGDVKVNFRFLSDLKFASQTYDRVLDTFSCSIQGKEKLTLRDLMRENLKFETIITTDELLKMVETTLVVGELEKNLPVPYINRLISVNTIDFKFLNEVENDTLVVISCAKQFDEIREHLSQYEIIKMGRTDGKWTFSNTDNSWSKCLSLSHTKSQTIYINESECTTNLLKELVKKDSRRMKYHHFKVVSGKLFWVESACAPEDLEKYCLCDDFITEEDFSTGSENKLQLICADPGMGKSVLMRSLQTRQPFNYWTVFISSEEYSLFFDSNTCNAVTFFHHVSRNKNCFESKFLEILIKNRQVIFFWDGLDEIPPKKLEMVIKIILEISQHEFFQFVTSRSNLKKFLENKLNVLARSIKPFDKTERNQYIMEKLNLPESDDIIQKITSSIEVLRCHDILGVPLHIYILTDLFLRDQVKYGYILNDHELFSIADLYSYFLDEKFNIYYKEKAKLDHSVDAVREIISTGIKYRINNYENASLNLISKNQRRLQNSFLEDVRKNGDCIGIITNVTNNGVPIFIHQSFGDYFVASYLAKNYKRETNIRVFLFMEEHKNIRFFFDLILAENCPAHVAVLYQNFKLVMSYEDELCRTDKAGRSPLHLACSWGTRYHPLQHQKEGLDEIKFDDTQISSVRESLEKRQMLEFLLLYCIPYQIDEIFQMDAFAYADASGSLYPMLLLTKTYKRQMKSFRNFKDINSILLHAIMSDYTEIFDILDVNKVIKEKVQWMVRTSLRLNSSRILEKLLFDTNYNKQIDKTKLPVHIACKHHNIEVLQLLIRAKISLNAVDESGCSPLSIACRHGHLDIVKLLIDHGATIDCPHSRLSPLAASCFGSHLAVVKFLVDSGADVNFLSKSGIYALHYAAISGNVSIAKILIDGGFDINTTCKITFEDVSALVLACSRGRTRMIGFLLDNGADVNMATQGGITPLHLACEMKSRKNVTMLIAAGANVNAVTEKGVSALHKACLNGHVEVAKILLDAGANVNCISLDRCTPLHMACMFGQIRVVMLLVLVGADVNVRSTSGRNALEIAKKKGYLKIVKFLSILNQ